MTNKITRKSIIAWGHGFGTAWLFAAMVGLWPIGTSAWAAPRSQRPTKTRTLKVSTDTLVAGGCLIDGDCEDGTACTVDRCVSGSCIHDAVAGCVACSPQVNCPPIDVVFIMDTSGSMRDEADALCQDMGRVVTDFASRGITINPTFLGITETQTGPFSCLTDSVSNLLGGQVPGDAAACPFPVSPSSFESWGPATAIVAQQFAWQAGARRVIIPLSDEGPCDGSFPDGCNDPGNDRASIDNAISVALANNVTVMPITGTGADSCTTTLARALALGTNGTSFQTTDPQVDLSASVFDMLLSMCDQSSPCDDGDLCTAADSCSQDGVCRGIDVSTVACQFDADCLTGSVCDVTAGQCVCQLAPDLCLEADVSTQTPGGCYEVGDEIIVRVALGISAPSIAGGQFLIGYDPTVLKFLSVDAGAVDDPASPFSNVVSTIIDEVNGSVFYAIGTEFGQPGTNGPETFAALHFRAIEPCTTTDLCFMDQNPKLTLLTDTTASRVPFTPCCISGMTLADAPPLLTCPDSVTVDADAGRRAALVSWNTPSVTDSCTGPTQLTCTATTDTGVPVDLLIDQGGLFAVGHTAFECVANNDCGQTSSCQWSVNVNDATMVEVDVQIAPPITDGPLTRCVEFTFYSTCAEAPVVVQKELMFGPPFNFPGQATGVPIRIEARSYSCATARDPKHTLLATAPMQIEGSKFVASFTGDPMIGGNWLIPGNLDGNDVIDMLDLFSLFQIWSPPQIATQPPDSACDFVGIHADLNGDGLVDAFDEAIIQDHMLATSSPICCVTSSPERTAAPTTSVSIKQLRQQGFGTLLYLDSDADGQIGLADINALLQRGVPSPLKTGTVARPR